MAQLNCTNLVLGYDGAHVVEDLTFCVNAGDYVCIVGENGSGKSTLMKTILGLMPPVKGDIQTSDGLKQNEIGYLPQQSAAQKDFPASVYEIVLSGFVGSSGWRPFYTRAQKNLALAHMEKLGIKTLSKRCYRELSGGQQQRVLLARALCAAEKLLLLDEPATGLDPGAARDFYEIINRLNREDGITIIMVSHDVNTALAYASHVLHIGGQTSQFFGPTDDYKKSGIYRAFTGRGTEEA